MERIWHDPGSMRAWLFAIIAALAAPAAFAAVPPTGAPRFPMRFTRQARRYTVYEPEVGSWRNNQLEERLAVSVENPDSGELTYGIAWISARTAVDQANRTVRLENLKITRVDFPSKPGLSRGYLSALREQLPARLKHVSLDRLQSDTAISEAEQKANPSAVQNTAPILIYSDTPAILILVDGNPTLRQSAIPGILRVINTRALMAFDTSDSMYYLYMGDRWLRAEALGATWLVASDAPPTLEQLREAVSSEGASSGTDLMNSPGSPLMRELRSGVVPQVFVSTVPAELIQTQGAPVLKSIPATHLLYVTNTASNLFFDEKNSDYYVLISGRWYRSPALRHGTWRYVPQSALPADFAKIPETSPKGEVLASVAGTPEAQEAQISDSVPRTATVNRAQANLFVQYDGAPTFAPIRGTPLRYARNTAIPVIEVDPHSFYAVSDGIWFRGNTPDGPWSPATSVPPSIYSIPPDCPIYYATFVRVYGSTPRYVYDGYTPGYLGSYLGDDGVVVHGTGFWYPSWIGSVWYESPLTFGGRQPARADVYAAWGGRTAVALGPRQKYRPR